MKLKYNKYLNLKFKMYWLTICILSAVDVKAKIFLAASLHLMKDLGGHLLQILPLLEQFILFLILLINSSICYGGIFLLHFFAFLSDFDWGVAAGGLSVLRWLKWSSTARLVREIRRWLLNLSWLLLTLILSVDLVLLAWCHTNHLLFVVIKKRRLHWLISIGICMIFIVHLLITCVGGWGVDLVSVLVFLIIWLIVHCR